MSKINEILSKRTPLRKEPDFKKVEGNFKNAANEAVELYKAQLQGQGTYNTKSIDPAASGGTLETDDQKYFKSLYDRFGDDVTTQELIDKKFLHSSKLDAYNTFTGGKNKGVFTPGEVTDVYKTKPITQTNQSSITTDKPMETNYNMGYNASVNANWAEGAQRRGTRRAERRANRDIRRYEEGSKGFLGFGKGKGKGELSANVLAAAEKTGKTIQGVNYDAEGNITGDADQKVTDQMKARAKSLSQNKYNQALNTEKITQLPTSETTTTKGPEITSNVKASDDAIDVSGYNMYDGGKSGGNGDGGNEGLTETQKRAVASIQEAIGNIGTLNLFKSKGSTKNSSAYKMPGYGKRK